MIWIKNVLPPTTKRVAIYTNPDVNEMIRNNTVENLMAYEDADVEQISSRIHSLNAEWDMERYTEAKAAAAIMGISLFGLSKHKCWSCISLITGVFLLQHALLGWCPSAPIMRKMGIRTAEEINQEKMVLKAMRKDFSHVKTDDIEDLFKIVEKQ